MAWASRRVSSAELLRNWAVACSTNFLGAAALTWLAGRGALAGRSVLVALVHWLIYLRVPA